MPLLFKDILNNYASILDLSFKILKTSQFLASHTTFLLNIDGKYTVIIQKG